MAANLIRCRAAFGLAVLLLTLGCLQARNASTNLPEQPTAGDSPRPIDPGAYVLGPNDVIEVRIYQEDDLNARERIRQDGTVTLPLLGPVALAGKTVDRATVLVRELLAKDYLVHPEVTISIVEYAKRRFIILGQVQRPGAYELPTEKAMHLLQAIASAGGYTRIGSPRKITVQRIVNGEQKTFRLDAESMSKDKEARPFEILPEDTITVGEKLF